MLEGFLAGIQVDRVAGVGVEEVITGSAVDVVVVDAAYRIVSRTAVEAPETGADTGTKEFFNTLAPSRQLGEWR